MPCCCSMGLERLSYWIAAASFSQDPGLHAGEVESGAGIPEREKFLDLLLLAGRLGQEHARESEAGKSPKPQVSLLKTTRKTDFLPLVKH